MAADTTISVVRWQQGEQTVTWLSKEEPFVCVSEVQRNIYALCAQLFSCVIILSILHICHQFR